MVYAISGNGLCSGFFHIICETVPSIKALHSGGQMNWADIQMFVEGGNERTIPTPFRVPKLFAHLCSAVSPHWKEPGNGQRIQRRNSCQSAQEKEGQRLKREQGKSSLGAKEASPDWWGGWGTLQGDLPPPVWGRSWEVTPGSGQSPSRELLFTEFQTIF